MFFVLNMWVGSFSVFLCPIPEVVPWPGRCEGIEYTCEILSSAAIATHLVMCIT